jgi:hypothetical protein
VAYAINTLSPNVIGADAVANPKVVKFTDATADSAGVDLGTSNRWVFHALIKIKASGGTQSFNLVFADNSALSTNPVHCGQSGVMPSTLLGTLVLVGVCDDAKQYVGIDATIGTSVTYDAVITLSPLS